MAPARMISFIKKHVADCSVCQEDPDIHDEVAKITEAILPESKIPKAVRSPKIADDAVDDEELEDEDSDNVDDDDGDDDETDEETDEDVDDDIDEDIEDDENDLLESDDS